MEEVREREGRTQLRNATLGEVERAVLVDDSRPDGADLARGGGNCLQPLDAAGSMRALGLRKSTNSPLP